MSNCSGQELVNANLFSMANLTKPLWNSTYHEVLAVIPSLGEDLNRLRAAINSVRNNSENQDYFLVIVDNSKDGTISELDGVDAILRYGVNLGWVGSLEIVRRSFNFKYLWTIQDDMVISNQALVELKSDLDQNPERGVACPIVVRDGIVPPHSLGAVMEDPSSLTWSSIPRTPTSLEELEIPNNLCCVFGSGALWRAEAMEEVGGFSINLFPVVNVDIDMCLRLLAKNWSLKLLVDAQVDHIRGASTNKVLTDTLRLINKELLLDNVTGRKPETESMARLDVDHEILMQIAAKSTHLILEVSKAASKELEEVRAHPWLNALFSSLLYQSAYSSNRRLQQSSNFIVRTSARLLRDFLKRILGLH